MSDETMVNNHSNHDKKHSIIGIISTCIAAFTVICTIISIIAAILIQLMEVNIDSESSNTIVGLLTIFLCVCSFVGTVLGVVGLFEKFRNRTTSVIGLVMNAVYLFALVVMIAIGLMT